MPEILRGRSPAKVNLVLEVLGQRADGYHEIDTVLQELALSGEVTVTLGEPDGVTVGGPFAAGVPDDASNLAWRAFELLREATGRRDATAAIHLDKRVPAAGGLGGGASDAAAVIRLLAGRWPEVTPSVAGKVARAVGSDEVFFLSGGTARAQGRGEVVTPLPPLAPHDVVLFVPPVTLESKTRRMFAALDAVPFDAGGRTAQLVAALAAGRAAVVIHNAFERVAYDVFDGLAALRRDIEARTGQQVHLAGAGPTLFWFGPTGAGARVAAAARGAACTVIPTATASAS